MRKFWVSATLVLIVSSIIIFAAGCGSDNELLYDSGSDGKLAPPQKEYDPDIDPDDFIGVIDNPYFPLTPGTIFTYNGETEDGEEKIVVEVTSDTKEILEVECIVVRDTVWLDENGDGIWADPEELAEDTYDWYAQDEDGNVWYFGEDSTEYENGVPVSTEGSWEAGVNDAKPGIVMLAAPRAGTSYRQEYYEGEAEDMAKVLRLNASVSVPYGDYEDCLVTKEWTPLERGVIEHKYYAPGVGLVMEVMRAGGTDRVELVEIVEP